MDSPSVSGSIKKIYRLPTNRDHFKSHAQIMRRASEIYDRKQEEQEKAKLQQKQDDPNNDSNKEVVHIQESVKKTIPAMEKDSTTQKSIRQFIALVRSKVPPIVTT